MRAILRWGRILKDVRISLGSLRVPRHIGAVAVRSPGFLPRKREKQYPVRIQYQAELPDTTLYWSNPSGFEPIQVDTQAWEVPRIAH